MHGRNRRCRGCDEMEFDYLYEERSESYSFYRIPKMLFTEGIFGKLSTEARVLYGLLLDRISLSRENGWVDEAGRVYVYYKIETVKKALRCANTKACGLLRELEEFGLVEKKKQGLGKPTLIYVKDFTRFRNAEPLNSEKQNSGIPVNRIQDFRKPESIKTERNKTENSDTESIVSIKKDRCDAMDEYNSYVALVRKNIEYELLVADYPHDAALLGEIVSLMTDVMTTKVGTIRICGDDKPVEIIKNRFMKLNSEHIRYVMQGLKDNPVKVRNIKGYLLASLYNAPATINNYYSALVNHDIANGRI